MLRSQPDKTMNQVIAWAYCAAIASLLLGLICNVFWTGGQLRRCGSVWRRAFAELCKGCRTTPQTENVFDPEVEEQIRRKLSAKEVQLAKLLMPWVCLIASRRALARSMDFIMGISIGRSVVQDGAFLFLFVGAGACTVYSRLLSQRTLVVWHVFFMTAMHFISTPFVVEVGASISIYQTKAFGGTLAISLLCFRFPVLVVTNVLYTAGIIVALATSIPADAGLPLDELMAVEVAYCLFKIVAFRFITRLVAQAVQGEVQSLAGTCQRSAVSSLLGMMCHVVLDLDQELAMKEHVEKLACMLMHGTGTTLKGRSFIELLANEQDRISFRESARRSVTSDELSTSMLSTSLRDSMGNCVSSMLFHVPYRSVGGRVHHLVGLREDGESRSEQPATSATPAMDEMPTAVLTEAMIRAARKQHRRSRRGPRTVRSEAMGGMRTSPIDDKGELVAEVVASDVLPFNRASERFVQNLGIAGDPVGRSFRAFLPEQTGDRFASWVREHSRLVLSGEREAFIGRFGEVEVLTAAPGERWAVEACFPKPHRELLEWHMYLVGIRLKPMGRSDQEQAFSEAARRAAACSSTGGGDTSQSL
mmetsp:Transcript_2259/g.6461  ORF Transcript_2259/g.6461 Transcript_2259/m.6461 type:complete len:590 (+) Transcript_2259:57-1826(+)